MSESKYLVSLVNWHGTKFLLKEIGKYRIERLIGRGSTSLVYLASDPKLSNQLAIKVFDTQLANDSKKMQVDFLQESKILFSLSSAAHVISFMDFDLTANGQAYIVMPYFERSLSDLLGSSNKLSINKTLSLAQQILSALQSIHQAGLIHRDIKPSNILLDDNDQVQVADFGISMMESNSFDDKTAAKGNNELPSSIVEGGVGSLYYASPEQLNGDSDLTKASDIYALSAIIYRCLTGLQFQHTQQALGDINSNIDEDLCRLIDLGLSAQPARRPTSAAEYSKAIAKVIDRLSEKQRVQQNLHSEANLDPERTRVWGKQLEQNDALEQLKMTIQNILLKEGEINQAQTSRLALLAEAELHAQYSDEWLKQVIQQTKTQLSLQNKQAAKFFLWIQQLNSALKVSRGRLNSADRERLISLALETLTLSKPEIIHIIEQKSPLVETDSIKHKNAVRLKKGRFAAMLFILACVFIIPWLLDLENKQIGDENTLSNSAQNLLDSQQQLAQRLVNEGQDLTQNNPINLSNVRINDSSKLDTDIGAIEVILQVQPKDADVVIQSSDGLPVSNSELQKAEYWLRISKNGYKTVAKKINVSSNRLLINEHLQLADTRYFIGNTDRTVADGIPVEFILLPQKSQSEAIFDANASDKSTTENSTVANQRIRMMSFEVTNELYSACVEAGKCSTSTTLSTDPRQLTFTNPQHPVVNVSWYDINEKFIPWLAAETASTLRLPTVDEWEYAAASSIDGDADKLRYSWGQYMLEYKAHCKDCNSDFKEYSTTTMPVRSFAANEWQLYDLHGNVQEWTSTCPEAAPTVLPSSSRQRCDLAIVKGGSWFSRREELFISHNDFLKKTVRSHTTGFRLVEEVQLDD